MSQLDPSVLASLASLAQRRSALGRGLSRRQVQDVVNQVVEEIQNTPSQDTAYKQRFTAFIPGAAEAKTNITHVTAITGVPILLPFNVQGTLEASRVQWQMSRISNGSNNFSVSVGLYSFANSTRLSLMGSNSYSFSNTVTSLVSGVRIFEVPMGTNISRMSQGDYVFAMAFNATNSLSANYSLMGGNTINAPMPTRIAPGVNNFVTALSHPVIPFWGRFSTTTSAMPVMIDASQAIVHGTAGSQPLPVWIAMATSG